MRAVTRNYEFCYCDLRAPLSPSKQPGPVSTLTYSSRSSLIGTALVQYSNCKVFYTQQGHCYRHNACHTPPKQGWYAVHSTPSRLLSARSVPCGWAYKPMGIDSKGLSSCLLPRHPKCLCQPPLVVTWARGCWGA